MEINYNSGISLAQKVNTLLNFLQDRNRKHVQTNADIGKFIWKNIDKFSVSDSIRDILWI